MSEQSQFNPRVFISYSWTNLDHEEWVVDLARRLMQDGIDVILDKWDLKEGHDIFAFMESMMESSNSIDKVLIICDKGYKEKADNRTGGVGVESQIITPQIYSDIQQEKFIPVVAERDEHNNHYIPVYIASRLYIDLSDSDNFEENYEKLIRSIYKVPLHQKPALGNAPSYLFENQKPHFPTASVLRQIKRTIDKYPNRVGNMWGEFVESFKDSLEQLAITEFQSEIAIDEKIINLIESTLPLRNDYIETLELFCQANQDDSQEIISFFESIYAFSEMRENGVYNKLQFDHYKFLITELFIYTILVLMKYRKFDTVAEIVNGDFYFDSRYNNGKLRHYSMLRFYLESLDYRKERLRMNKISIHANLYIDRAPKKYVKEFVCTDLLLYFISKIATKEEILFNTWFPTTYIYLEREEPLKVINRLKSRKHFENVKQIFNVETPEIFIEKVSTIQSDKGYSEAFGNIPSIQRFINPIEICTIP